jgi:hypothetical protein
MFLLLDLFHAMRRVTDTISKCHGVHRLFCCLLRDCFFMIYKEDSEKVDLCLRELKGYTPSEVKAFKRANYTKYISYCRRVVPPKKQIIARLQRLIDVFRDLQDSTTGEKLFKEATDEAVRNLSEHINSSCLSDPPGVPMYIKVSRKNIDFDKSDLPLPRWTTLRSTSQIEGHHSHVVKATGAQSSSESVRHENLMEYTYRLNHRQAMKHGLVSLDLSDFYELFLLENINSLRLLLGKDPIYTDVCSIFDYADTGERFGFRQSSMDYVEAGSYEIVDTAVFASSECLPISSKDETTKFNRELSRVQAVNRSKINYGDWATRWNIDVQRMRDHQSSVLDIFPKTGAHLKKHFDSIVSTARMYHTTAQIRDELGFISSDLRRPDSSNHPLPLELDTLRAREAHGRQYPQTTSPGNTNEATASVTKRAITCSYCGHRKGYGKYGKTPYHSGQTGSCSVPESERIKKFSRAGEFPCQKEGCYKAVDHYHPCIGSCCKE